MTLSTSIFKWNGNNGEISHSDLAKACGGRPHEWIEVRSDRTGTKIVFGKGEGSPEYFSIPNRTFKILVKSNFPLTSPKDIKGKRFAITGTLSMPREEVADLILSSGGEFTNRVDSKTSYIIVGKDPGRTKLNEASRRGIPTLNGDSFMDLFQVSSLQKLL